MSKVVVYVDGSPESKAAVRWCAEHLTPGTTVFAICGFNQLSEFALSIPPLGSDAERQVDDVLRHDWCAPLAAADLDLHAQVVRESDADALIDTATREQPDALVIGRRVRHSFAELFSLSPFHRIVHQMPCPIFVIPAE